MEKKKQKKWKNKAFLGATSLILSASVLTGCSENLPPEPTDKACSAWEWDDEDGVWECDSTSSAHYGHYYYGGRYFSSRSSLNSDSSFSKYKSSSSFKGGFSKGSSGGFGG